MDARLLRSRAVVEYSGDPACVFRLDIGRCQRQLTLRDGTRLQPGERIVQLHFWNEHVPSVPPNGATIGWARQMQQSIVTSLRELVHYLSSRTDLHDLAAIFADVPSATKAQSEQLRRIMMHYGFEVVADDEHASVGQRMHRFGQNILISMIVFAQNSGALRRDSLLRARVPIAMSRRILEQRFGPPHSPPQQAYERGGRATAIGP